MVHAVTKQLSFLGFFFQCDSFHWYLLASKSLALEVFFYLDVSEINFITYKKYCSNHCSYYLWLREANFPAAYNERWDWEAMQVEEQMLQAMLHVQEQFHLYKPTLPPPTPHWSLFLSHYRGFPISKKNIGSERRPSTVKNSQTS